MKTGFLYVVAAPSGAGKTSLVASLINSVEDVVVSISYTTRPCRPGETADVEYHFVHEAVFEKMIEEHAFLEYAKVYQHYYGTSRQWVLERLNQGVDVILEIDWQGAQQIREKFPEAVLVFILPPSMSVLEERLQRRQQDAEDVIAHRMASARNEISHYNEYDYLVVNDDFGEALSNLRRIVRTQRLRRCVQEHKLAPLLQALLAE
ncbi:MAG: guanylate kinase [Gammaproteobacteria bacterium]|nr:guanylate kinase [Gammaproteobacteria bacterium]MCH9743952.1 guanylate kinase [Gammaproteobacteria bacterium]